MDDLFELIDYVCFHFRRIFWRAPPLEPSPEPPGQKFPLADLPLVPLLVVIQNMDIRTILSLSAQSTKFKNIAKLHTRKMQTRYRSAYSCGSVFAYDTYHFDDYPSPERYHKINPWCLGGTRDWWDMVWNKPQKLLHVNGCPFYFKESYGTLGICNGRSWRCPFEEFPEAISHFLLDMFSGNQFDAFLYINKPQFPPLPCLNQSFRRVCFVSSSDLMMTPEMLKRALEDLTSAEALEIGWKIPGEFKYTKGLRYPKMIIRNAHWLTLESILHMKCVHLDADHTRLTDFDVNKIIRKVIEGGFDGLDRIIIGSIHALQWNKSVLLAGVDWKSMDFYVEVTGNNGRQIVIDCESQFEKISIINSDSGQLKFLN